MTGLSYEMMCAAALFFCAKRAGKDRENCKRRDYRFALTDLLNKEYNKPIDTDGVIDIYPNVKRRKYREENKKRMTLTAR